VYVRTKRESPQRMPAREHRQLSENVTLAMELGAKVVWLTGENIAEELRRFAREHGVTLVVFGKSGKSLWRRAFRKSPLDAFAAGGTGLDVLEIETGTA
jgi:two-component system, OmpR family, sensor histidine kinase KdpD